MWFFCGVRIRRRRTRLLPGKALVADKENQMPPTDWPLVPSPEADFDVLPVQYLLMQHGAALEPDGVFGTLTEAAVREFQAAQGLAVDGSVGNETWRALIVTVSEGSEGDAVRAVQSMFNIAVDGVFGPMTDKRVRDLQEMFGATVDGIVGPETWFILVSPKSE